MENVPFKHFLHRSEVSSSNSNLYSIKGLSSFEVISNNDEELPTIRLSNDLNEFYQYNHKMKVWFQLTPPQELNFQTQKNLKEASKQIAIKILQDNPFFPENIDDINTFWVIL